jgi:hypothetical protein
LQPRTFGRLGIDAEAHLAALDEDLDHASRFEERVVIADRQHRDVLKRVDDFRHAPTGDAGHVQKMTGRQRHRGLDDRHDDRLSIELLARDRSRQRFAHGPVADDACRDGSGRRQRVCRPLGKPREVEDERALQ